MKKTSYEEWVELLDSNNNNKNINSKQYSGIIGSTVVVSDSSLSLGWGKWKGMLGSAVIST